MHRLLLSTQEYYAFAAHPMNPGVMLLIAHGDPLKPRNKLHQSRYI